MFTEDNTDGFTSADLTLMNKALARLMARAGDCDDYIREQLEETYSARINNNWMSSGNTIKSLIAA